MRVNKSALTNSQVRLPFVKLNNYTINLSDGIMVADSAMLTYKDRFKEPIMGKFIDKPLSGSQGVKSNYPQFESTTQTLTKYVNRN